MFRIDTEELQHLLLEGNYGLEMEGLRVNKDGFLAQTSHPFPGDAHIVRDFCDNQTEINTDVCRGVDAAVKELKRYYTRIQRTLSGQGELLWPFSNPPYIRKEADIPVAQFQGSETAKTQYRNYLSDRYGRYKMTLSGIHVNYSFHEELLRKEFEKSSESDYTEYVNDIYMELAEKALRYGWILTAVTAASPVLDGSYVEKGKAGEDVFLGLASVRDSELGYWNFFTPILDYSDVTAYADSIEQYVKDGWLRSPSELYYPIRIKPRGINSLDNLRKEGVSHIELRMFDLNPLTECGIDERDVAFAGLFLGWLAALPKKPITQKEQIEAIQNFKSAAHFDLKTVKITAEDGSVCTVARAALSMLEEMKAFYRDYPDQVKKILDFQESKFTDADNRYAWQIRDIYGSNYVKKGIILAEQRQEKANV